MSAEPVQPEAPSAGPTQDFDRCAVIGGSGMLGFEIVRQLVAADKQVRILDLQAPPESLCEVRMGDIRDGDAVAAACSDAEVVFQTAAAVWDTGTPAAVYEEVNVQGNRLVSDARARRDLGYQPRAFESTLADTLLWSPHRACSIRSRANSQRHRRYCT